MDKAYKAYYFNTPPKIAPGLLFKNEVHFIKMPSPDKPNPNDFQKKTPGKRIYEIVNIPVDIKEGILKNAKLGDFSKMKNDLKILKEENNFIKVKLEEKRSIINKLNGERHNTQKRMEISFQNQPERYSNEKIIQALENQIIDLQYKNAAIENSLIERNSLIEGNSRSIMNQEEIRNKSLFTILTISSENERLHQIISSLKGYLQQNQERETILQQNLKDNETTIKNIESKFTILSQLSDFQKEEIQRYKNESSIESGLQEELQKELNNCKFYQKALIDKKEEHEKQIKGMKNSFQYTEDLSSTLCDKEMEISNLRDELTQMNQINNEKEELMKSIERLYLKNSELSYNLNEYEENTKSIINSLDMLKEEIINLKSILSQNEKEINDLKNANKRTLIELSELEQYKYQNQKLLLEIQEISDAAFY